MEPPQIVLLLLFRTYSLMCVCPIYKSTRMPAHASPTPHPPSYTVQTPPLPHLLAPPPPPHRQHLHDIVPVAKHVPLPRQPRLQELNSIPRRHDNLLPPVSGPEVLHDQEPHARHWPRRAARTNCVHMFSLPLTRGRHQPRSASTFSSNETQSQNGTAPQEPTAFAKSRRQEQHWTSSRAR